jgi:hypothetical protein
MRSIPSSWRFLTHWNRGLDRFDHALILGQASALDPAAESAGETRRDDRRAGQARRGARTATARRGSGSRRVAFEVLEPSFRGLSERSVPLTVRRVWTPRRTKSVAPVVSDQNAVITHLRLSDDAYATSEERNAVFALEERLIDATEAIGGEHDGNEFGGGEAVLFTYGPNADTLFATIQACLLGEKVRPGSYAIKRFGNVNDPAAREERVELA